MDAAGNAQGAQTTRGQNYLGNQFLMGDRLSGLYSSIMGPGLDNDAAIMGDANSGGVAGANAGVANEQANANTLVDTAKTGAAAYDYFKKP
jgi:hypothetical protein